MAQVVWVYHSDGRRSSEGCMNGISLCRICVFMYFSFFLLLLNGRSVLFN